VNLFESEAERQAPEQMPLAARMRPRSLEEFLGQEQVVGPDTFVGKAIRLDRVPAMIWHGPPGSGKTTLAHIIRATTKRHFVTLSAVEAGVAEILQAAEAARLRQQDKGQGTILFVEEIHRLNKAQQDRFLPFVEDGTFTLIGSTTENPFFYIIPPLLSRCRVVVFNPLSDEQVRTIVERSLHDPERGYGGLDISLEPEALEHLVVSSAGDARHALNMLELIVEGAGGKGPLRIGPEAAMEAAQKRLQHDRAGDAHYDVVSAFIKSMRGSDPDAALYWMGRMIYAGEDPRFIARRILIHAAEDVGMADPMALVVAAAAATAVETVGLPECQIPLAEAVIYIATAPKSNTCYQAIAAAMKDVQERKAERVPPHLRDSSYAGAARLGHGVDYQYPHSFGGYVAQQYLPDGLVGRRYYEPSQAGFEAEIEARLRRLREAEEKE
jgi:putative ATPase